MRFGAAPVAAAALAVVPAGPVRALDVSLDLSVRSAYIWRGMVLNDRPSSSPRSPEREEVKGERANERPTRLAVFPFPSFLFPFTSPQSLLASPATRP